MDIGVVPKELRILCEDRNPRLSPLTKLSRNNAAKQIVTNATLKTECAIRNSDGAVLGMIAWVGIIAPITWMRRSTPARGAQTELALGGGAAVMPLVPFGVFLAPAAVINLVWGEQLMRMIVR